MQHFCCKVILSYGPSAVEQSTKYDQTMQRFGSIQKTIKN